MKLPGDDGYDFPCGGSHSRIDYAYEDNGQIRFGNNLRMSDLYSVVTEEDVLEFKEKMLEQARCADMWLKARMNK